MAKKLDYKYCKAAPMLEWLGNKWALVVLVKIFKTSFGLILSNLSIILIMSMTSHIVFPTA